MNLYCVKFYDKNDNIADVTHMVADSNKEVHLRLDATIRALKTKNLDNYDYSEYRFFQVEEVDGNQIDVVKDVIF